MTCSARPQRQASRTLGSLRIVQEPGQTFGMVNVPRLVSAVENLAWRHGVVTGDAVRYRVEADGAHVITIAVPPTLVDQASLPKPPVTGGGLGAVSPDMKKNQT